MKILIEDEVLLNSRLIGMTPNELKTKGFPIDIIIYKPFYSSEALIFNDLSDEMRNEKITNLIVDERLGKVAILGDWDSPEY